MMTPEQAQEKAKQDVGVLLPDVDPVIGEMVLSAFYANPQAHPAQIAAALALQAPDPRIAEECVSAVFEFLLCREKGHLYWVETTAQAVLMGVRRVKGTDAVVFGAARWPMAALLVGPPQNVVVRLSGENFRRVWLASESMDGFVMRQSDTIALGNAIVERFGGRIIEDRHGAEAMRDSFYERKMTDRAKKRADALSEVERLTIESRKKAVDIDRARVAMAESVPGSCEIGLRVVPFGKDSPVFYVEQRVNDSWVLIAAADGEHNLRAAHDIGPAEWVREDGKPPVEGWPMPHVGFTEDQALAR